MALHLKGLSTKKAFIAILFQSGCPESVSFLRQNSCPVTQNEKYVVNNCPHGRQAFQSTVDYPFYCL